MQDAERAGAEAEVSHSIELQPGSETNMQTLAETFAWQRASSALAELRAWRGCRKGERRRGEQGKQRQHSTPGRKHWEEKGGEDRNGLGVCTALREARQRKQDGGGTKRTPVETESWHTEQGCASGLTGASRLEVEWQGRGRHGNDPRKRKPCTRAR
ncbi:hypothetical protein ERJ75_001094400 [Trypanosoma vivax]|nr:hypothetical protein ERJ75_001094400 [Trypanosoma vivax]